MHCVSQPLLTCLGSDYYLRWHCAGYGYPAEAVNFFLKEAKSRGASIVCSQPVQKLEAADGKVTGASHCGPARMHADRYTLHAQDVKFAAMLLERASGTCGSIQRALYLQSRQQPVCAPSG